MPSRGQSTEALLERASRVRPDWTPTDADVPALARICRELDGIPLALDLTTSIHWLWRTRGRRLEGARWLDEALADAPEPVGPEALAGRSRALSARARLGIGMSCDDCERVDEAVRLARAPGDQALLVRALTAGGG
jgi:hypothetical protein